MGRCWSGLEQLEETADVFKVLSRDRIFTGAFGKSFWVCLFEFPGKFQSSNSLWQLAVHQIVFILMYTPEAELVLVTMHYRVFFAEHLNTLKTNQHHTQHLYHYF